MIPRVKICGITNLNDALIAVEHGADAIGLRIRPKLSLEAARAIAKSVPPFVTRVVLTREISSEKIIETCKYVGVSTLQAYGELTKESIETIRDNIPGIKIIRAIPVIDQDAIRIAKELENIADALLLDTQDLTTGQIGGTGKPHDWSISREIVSTVRMPIILAGGLNPDNVVEAIQTVRCWGVDCETGVEKSDGIKDSEKVCDFIALCKSIRI